MQLQKPPKCPYLEDLELPEPQDVESKLSVDPSPLAPGGFSRSWPPEESSPLPVTSQATRDVPLPPAMPQEWSSLCHRPPCPPPEQLCVHPSAGALNCFIFSVGPCHPTDLSLGHAAPLFQPNEQLPCSTSPEPLCCCFLFFIPGDFHHPFGSAEFVSGGDTLCHGH